MPLLNELSVRLKIEAGLFAVNETIERPRGYKRVTFFGQRIPGGKIGNGMAICRIDGVPTRAASRVGSRQSGKGPSIFRRFPRNLAAFCFRLSMPRQVFGLLSPRIFLEVLFSVLTARSYILVTQPTHDCNISRS